MNSTSEQQPAPHTWWPVAGGGLGRLNRWLGTETVAGRLVALLPVRGTLKSPPVTGPDGSLYVADAGGWVRAFDADNALRWESWVKGGVIAAPALDSSAERLFLGTLEGEVIAFSTASGKPLWRRALPTASDPRILSDLLWLPRQSSGSIWVSSWGGRFLELDATDGQPRSSWDAGIFPQSAAAATEAGEVFFLRAVEARGVELVRVARGDETILLRTPPGRRGARRTWVTAGPVVDEAHQRIWVVMNCDRNARLAAVALKEGRLLWETDLPACVGAALTVNEEGTLYLADLAGHVATLDLEGRLQWRTDTGCEYLLSAPVLDGAGNAWLGDPWGRLLQINRQGQCRVVASWERSIKAPAGFRRSGQLCVPITRGGVALLR